MQAWVLALASSAHLSVAVVRQHRCRPGARRVALVATSYAWAALPWFFASAPAVLLGLAAHAAWFVATDSFARRSASLSPGADATRGRRPSPVVVATGTVAPSPPQGFTPLPVLAVFDETPDIRTFRVTRPDGWTFKAGQFLAVRLRVDGREHVRCYSISSAPEATGFFEISVKRQGLVSSALHATVRPGSTLFARPPAGHFVYPADDDRPLVLLAAGVGITPLISMVRHGVLVDPLRPVTLIQLAREPQGLAFADELRVLERRYPCFRWVPAVSGGRAAAEHYPGRIDDVLLRTTVPDVSHSVVCVCGPESMIASVRESLERLGVSGSQVRHELFEAVVAATGSRPVAGVPAEGADTTLVTFLRSEVRQPARQGQTLLDAAEAGGVSIPTMCRAGVCGTCRTRVVDGDVHCPSDALGEDDAAAGYVLACISAVRTDCSVEA